MRALSLAQASRCETAKNPGCRCRCHGAMHGVKRMEDRSGYVLVDDGLPGETGKDQLLREFFEQLPEDDPHHVRSAAEKRKRAKIKRAAAKAPLQGRLWPALAEDERA